MSAKTGETKTVTLSGSFVLNDIAAWLAEQDVDIGPVLAAEADLAGCGVALSVDVRHEDEEGNPSETMTRVYALLDIVANPTEDPEVGSIQEAFLVGVGVLSDITELWEWTWNDSGSPVIEYSIVITPFLRTKVRVVNSDRIPVEPDGPSSPCHAVHFDEVDAWVSDETTECTVTAGGFDLTRPFEWEESPELPAATVAAGCAVPTVTPASWPSGAVVTHGITEFTALADPDAFEMPGEVTALHGMETSFGTAYGTGNNLVVTLDGDPVTSSLAAQGTRQADKYGTFDLIVRNWAETYSGAELTLPVAPDGSPTEDVGSPYSAQRVYKEADWWEYARPEYIRPLVASAWAATADEDVDPDDLECELEESGLDADPSPTYDCAVLKIRREPAVSVHHPADVTTPASSWSLDGTTLSRTLIDNYPWLLSKDIDEGYDAVGPPQNYEWLRHWSDADATALGTYVTDVTNWANFGFLKLTYTSDAAMTLALSVVNRTYTITDQHVTGGARKSGFSWSTADAAHDLGSVPIVVGASQVVYIDLQRGSDRLLQHVLNVTFEGVTGGTLTIVDLELVAYNPATEVEGVGRLDLLASYRRVDPASELPLDYVGYRGTAEGARAIVAPDETEDRTGEAGLRCVERLTGDGTGEILDHLVELDAVATNLAHQEGIVVDGFGDSPPPWEAGAAAFDAAFEDADSDLQLGTLYASDVAEVYDGELGTHSSTLTAVIVRPRVGRLRWAAGRDNQIVVRKVLRGNLHGLVRDGSGNRAADQPMTLWEVDAVDRTPVSAAAQVTDDWGRYRFGGLGGFREERYGLARSTADGEPSASSLAGWYQVRNRGRDWLPLIVTIVTPGHDGICMAYSPWGTVVIARGYGIRWPSEPASGPGLLVDRYSRYENDGLLPALTVQAHAERRFPGLHVHAGGRLWLVAEDDGDIVLMDSAATGSAGSDVDLLTGHTHPALASDPHLRHAWMVARRTSDGEFVVFALRRPTGADAPEFEQLAELGDCDEVTGDITVIEDGGLYVVRVLDSTIHAHLSLDGGYTWAELTA